MAPPRSSLDTGPTGGGETTVGSASSPLGTGDVGLVVIRGIRFATVCEHSLPFRGVAHVGYLPAEGRIMAACDLARGVDAFARRPPPAPSLAAEVAGWLDDRLAPHGIGVVVEAVSTCLTAPTGRADGAHTVTVTLRGLIRDDPHLRSGFLRLVRDSG